MEKMKAARRELSYAHLFFPSTRTASASFLSVPGWTLCVRACVCVCVCLCVCVLVAQLSLTLCNPMDSSPPGSVHGILQARILEWVVISFSKRSSWPRDWTWASYIAGRFFTAWTTREAHGPSLFLSKAEPSHILLGSQEQHGSSSFLFLSSNFPHTTGSTPISIYFYAIRLVQK